MNKVIAGDYKGQGLMIQKGVVVITLPMFKVVAINRRSVRSYYVIEGKKRRVYIEFWDGKASVLDVNDRYFGVLMTQLLNLPRSSNEKAVLLLSQYKPHRARNIFLSILIFFVVFCICINIAELIYPTVDGQIQLSFFASLLCLVIPVVAAIYLPSFIPSLIKMGISYTKKKFESNKTQKEYENLSEVEKWKLEKEAPFQPANACEHAEAFAEKPTTAPIDTQKIIQQENEWRREQQGLSSAEYELQKIDHMEGHQFEYWCAQLLKRNGFDEADVTQGSGDQGVDIVAVKDDIRYAVQCKCYSSDLGNKPIQEVNTGKIIYRCQIGAVMTNRYFTAGAKAAAEATGVLLWDRDKLKDMI